MPHFVFEGKSIELVLANNMIILFLKYTNTMLQTCEQKAWKKSTMDQVSKWYHSQILLIPKCHEVFKTNSFLYCIGKYKLHYSCIMPHFVCEGKSIELVIAINIIILFPWHTSTMLQTREHKPCKKSTMDHVSKWYYSQIT